MNRVSISNLSKKGEVPVHLAVIAALMGEMAVKGVDFRAVLARIKIEPQPAKGLPLREYLAARRTNQKQVLKNESAHNY